MAAATGVVIFASARGSLPVFLVGFVALFVLTRARQRLDVQDDPRHLPGEGRRRGLAGEAAAAYGRRLSGAAMGLIGAVGALGGLGINLAFRQAFQTAGSGTAAFVAFLAFYAVCCAVTWAVYLRRGGRPPGLASRADAEGRSRERSACRAAHGARRSASRAAVP